MTWFGWQTHRRQLGKTDGFTSIELLAALVSSLLIIFVGFPAFEFLTDNGEAHLLEQPSLANHLDYARSEAIRRKLTVTVCPSKDNRNCQNQGNWQDGWIIFTDNEGLPRHVSVGDKMLHNQKGVSAVQPLIAHVDVVQYREDGSIRLD
ncbi:MAG: GspH/FimT family pseudopilin [Candidatus Thiodiazotropha sp. (ex Monitilora ramsayi)]|nr:GspH/FimT family pseudopilin [Candidatus Thiodiazotropha sp. (ex Monitilora ramsayi)]